MTAADIAQRYASGPQTPERLLKVKGLAQRSDVPWRDVEAALPSVSARAASVSRGTTLTKSPPLSKYQKLKRQAGNS